jgi:hypothetical protein
MRLNNVDEDEEDDNTKAWSLVIMTKAQYNVEFNVYDNNDVGNVKELIATTRQFTRRSK